MSQLDNTREMFAKWFPIVLIRFLLDIAFYFVMNADNNQGFILTISVKLAEFAGHRA